MDPIVGPVIRRPRPWMRASAFGGLALIMALAACAGPASTGSAAGGELSRSPAVDSGTASGSTADASGSTADASGSAGGAGDSPNGRTFLATGVRGHTALPDQPIRVSFEQPGTIVVQGGCNTLNGPVSLADGHLSVAAEGVMITEMACANAALMDQDSWLAAFLWRSPTWQLAGDTLILTSGSVSITLLDRVTADPDRPLTGTVWKLTGTLDAQTAGSIPDGIDARLSLTAGTFGIKVCNAISGGARAADGHLALAGFTSTLMACPGPRGELESTVVSVLNAGLKDGLTYRIQADSLTLTAADGHGLMFTAVAGEPTGSASPLPGPAVGPTPTASASPVLPSTAPAPVSSAAPAPVSSTGSAPAPSPVSSTGPAPSASPVPVPGNALAGRTFRLVRLFTDAGAVDTRSTGSHFEITFADYRASATSQCGKHEYPDVTVGTKSGGLGLPVDLGVPTGAPCSLGRDPGGLPQGRLYFAPDPSHPGEFWLTTGFVAWIVQEVTG